jgi:hypothetical protein
MYTPFLIAATLSGGPPFLAAALLAYFSNLSAGLTHYGADARTDLFRRRLRHAAEVVAVGLDRLRRCRLLSSVRRSIKPLWRSRSWCVVARPSGAKRGAERAKSGRKRSRRPTKERSDSCKAPRCR